MTRIGHSLTIKSISKVENPIMNKVGESIGVCKAYILQKKLEKSRRYLREESESTPHISKKALQQLEQDSLESSHSAGNDDEIAYKEDFYDE